MVAAALWGTAAGILVGFVGFVSAFQVAVRFRRDSAETRNTEPKRGDVWRPWAIGMLIRLVLLTVLVFLFMAVLEDHLAYAVLSMSGVYLLALFGEAGWLYKILITRENGKKHG